MGGCPEHDDLYEYVLAGMEDEQRERVKEHLSKCPPCLEQIKEYAAVNDGLALAVPDVDCPETMAKAVLNRIQAENRSAPAQRMPMATGWAMFWMRLGPVFAVLSIVMTMITMVALQKMGGTASPGANNVDVARISALMANPFVQTISLKSPKKGGKCSGSITCSKDNKSMMMTIDKLKRCPAGSVYIVWSQAKNGDMARLGSFSPGSGGAETFFIDMDKALDPAQTANIKVTLEPHAKVEKPTGQIHLAGTADL